MNHRRIGHISKPTLAILSIAVGVLATALLGRFAEDLYDSAKHRILPILNQDKTTQNSDEKAILQSATEEYFGVSINKVISHVLFTESDNPQIQIAGISYWTKGASPTAWLDLFSLTPVVDRRLCQQGYWSKSQCMTIREKTYWIESAVHDANVEQPVFVPAAFAGEDYLVVHDTQGRGAYLYVWVFRVNNAGRPELVYFVDDMPSGGLYHRSGRIFVRGGEKRYELVADRGKFRLVEYEEKFNCDPTDGSHVLSISPNQTRSASIVSFDCHGVATLEEGWNENIKEASTILDLRVGEIVTIHSLLSDREEIEIRFVSNGILEYRDGLYGSIVATAVGSESIGIGVGGQWVRLRFKVE